MKHELKIEPAYFEAIITRLKTFEIRYNDRCFQAGHTVVLKEYYPESQRYTGRELIREIGWVTSFAQKEGWCVFSLLELDKSEWR